MAVKRPQVEGIQGPLRDHGTDALQAATADVDALYISLDTDVIDPAFQPGQKLPDAAGLTAREVMLALRTLVAESPVPIIGFDTAENEAGDADDAGNVDDDLGGGFDLGGGDDGP